MLTIFQYWRRRFFRLSGSKFTSYHESTHQPRATINLAKAIKLIDDKSSLTQQTTSSRGGGRRKSAFAQEEEGYMYLEEGFRVRFANGETIDFYADTAAEKDAWMAALSQVVGKEARNTSRSWTDLVLKREKALRALNVQKEKEGKRGSSRNGGRVPSQTRQPTSQQAPPPASPSKMMPGEPIGPPPAPPKDRRAMTPAERRGKSQSTLY